MGSELRKGNDCSIIFVSSVVDVFSTPRFHHRGHRGATEKSKMPGHTRKELEQALKQGQIEPVYFLFGPETYLRDEAARAIADEALRGTLLREFNESSFSLTGDDVRSAIAIAEQLPMMSERRVVRIKDFGKLAEKEEEVLLNYLDRPVETSVVIF